MADIQNDLAPRTLLPISSRPIQKELTIGTFSCIIKNETFPGAPLEQLDGFLAK